MVKVAYDAYYKEEEYFGAPYKGLVDFFMQHEPKGIVLDLGCGQGRDSIPIARMGYEVIAVDHSSVGVENLKSKASLVGVKINTVVGDIYTMDIAESVDIILLDSMLHFYKNDIEKESALVNKIMRDLKVGGIFVNCILKGKKREETLKGLISQSTFKWEILSEKYVDYPEASCEYHMLAIKKAL